MFAILLIVIFDLSAPLCGSAGRRPLMITLMIIITNIYIYIYIQRERERQIDISTYIERESEIIYIYIYIYICLLGGCACTKRASLILPRPKTSMRFPTAFRQPLVHSTVAARREMRMTNARLGRLQLYTIMIIIIMIITIIIIIIMITSSSSSSSSSRSSCSIISSSSRSIIIVCFRSSVAVWHIRSRVSGSGKWHGRPAPPRQYIP